MRLKARLLERLAALGHTDLGEQIQLVVEEAQTAPPVPRIDADMFISKPDVPTIQENHPFKGKSHQKRMKFGSASNQCPCCKRNVSTKAGGICVNRMCDCFSLKVSEAESKLRVEEYRKNGR